MVDAEKLCMGCMKEKPDVASVCPHCGFDAEKYEKERQGTVLPSFTILNGRYLIGKVLGMGGFGITYLAYDLKRESKTAIKEFFPAGYTFRNTKENQSMAALSVQMVTGMSGAAYYKGMESLEKEGEILADLNYDSVVKVLGSFRENNTAYIVMEYVEGVSIRDHMRKEKKLFDPTECIQMMRPLIKALDGIHAKNLIHRDISTDNVIMKNRYRLKLIDFGAARHVYANETNSLSVILKHGYAPPEQYSTKGKQGPWTDVYALCATMMYMMTGKLPDEAFERFSRQKEEDEAGILQILESAGVEKRIADILLRGLAVRIEGRIASMAELESLLFPETKKERYKASTDREVKKEASKKDEGKKDVPDKEALKEEAPKKEDTKRQEKTGQKAKKKGKFTFPFVAIILALGVSVYGNRNDLFPKEKGETSAFLDQIKEEASNVFVPAGDQSLTEDAERESADFDDASAEENVREQGYVVSFGTYEQDGLGSNGKEPIRWQVLKIEDTNALLFSEKILDQVIFEETYFDSDLKDVPVTWAESDMRSWLNEIFYFQAFSEEERKAILETRCVTPKNEYFHTDGGLDTQDKVFLFSIEELKALYDTDQVGYTTWRKGDGQLSAKVTQYAKEKGVFAVTPEKAEELPDLYTQNDMDNGKYWLRSPGEKINYISYVDETGYMVGGGSFSAYDIYGVRPAIWVDLEKSGLKEKLELMSEKKAADTETIYTDAETIRHVQQRLNDLGYSCGVVDGKAGKKTAAAIEAYQKEQNLSAVTGTINDELLDSLGIASHHN